MTFGSVFGRTFSPTFQPSSQAAASSASTWWDLNGTITSCVAAYQPKGAADYASSLTDLSGSSHDAVEVSGQEPTWDVTNGWKFNAASTQVLVCPLYPTDLYTAIVRFTNTSVGYLIGRGDASRNDRLGFRDVGASIRCYFGDAYTDIATTQTSGVFGINTENVFVDGSATAITATMSSNTYSRIGIGALEGNTGCFAFYLTGYIQALAIYNATLTPTQMAALTTAMAAL